MYAVSAFVKDPYDYKMVKNIFSFYKVTKYFVTDYEANPKLNQYTIINKCLSYFSHRHFIKKEILDEKYNSVEKFLNKQPCLYALVYSSYNVPQQIENLMFEDMIRIVLNHVDNV